MGKHAIAQPEAVPSAEVECSDGVDIQFHNGVLRVRQIDLHRLRDVDDERQYPIGRFRPS